MKRQKYWAQLFGIVTMLALMTVNASATGPRIKQDLFAPNTNSIYALDFPPFISTELPDGGLATALTHTMLEADHVDAPITTLPLARMLKYYLTQENALALIGNHLSFSAEAQKELIFVPILRLKQYYYVHQSKHPQGLPWKGELQTLTNYVYGANPEQDVSRLQKAGILIETGKLLTLLEKLQTGQIDFLGENELAVDWFLQRNLATDKARFIRLEPMSGEDTVYVIFNKKHPQGETMAKQFQARLATMVTNGQYQALLEKQLGGAQAVERHTLPLTPSR